MRILKLPDRPQPECFIRERDVRAGSPLSGESGARARSGQVGNTLILLILLKYLR